MKDVPLLESNQVTKTFGTTLAVCSVDLRLYPRDCVALLGRNGAGKTTLLRMILGVTEPTSGSIHIRGISAWHHGALARETVGFVAERPSFPRGMTCRALLNFVAQFYADFDLDYAVSLASRFHIPLLQQLRKLSKGMLGQISLITAVAHRPSLLILDEPFGSMDPVTRALWRSELADLAKTAGAGCLFSTHLLEDAFDISNRIVIIHNGTIRVDVSSRVLHDGVYLCAASAGTELDVERLSEQVGECLVRCDQGVVISIPKRNHGADLTRIESLGYQLTPLDLAGLFRVVAA